LPNGLVHGRCVLPHKPYALLIQNVQFKAEPGGKIMDIDCLEILEVYIVPVNGWPLARYLGVTVNLITADNNELHGAEAFLRN
jgi:hypothetical protein